MRLYENYVSSQDRLALLRLFSQFDENETKADFDFQYIIQGEDLARLREKFDYPARVVPGKEFRSLVGLMVWVFDHLIGDVCPSAGPQCGGNPQGDGGAGDEVQLLHARRGQQ